jgi:hypothetical protein
MQHNPSWESSRFSSSQEIPRILWNQKVHHRTHKCPPPVPILKQLDSGHVLTSHLLNIRLTQAPNTPSTKASRALYRLLTLQAPKHLAPYTGSKHSKHQSISRLIQAPNTPSTKASPVPISLLTPYQNVRGFLCRYSVTRHAFRVRSC